MVNIKIFTCQKKDQKSLDKNVESCRDKKERNKNPQSRRL